MSEQKQVNMAENQLIVGSVKVLNDISGGSVDIIRQQNKDMAQTVATFTKKQQDYWSDIANDRTISAAEKKTLKREFTSIDQTHTALMQSATEKGIAQVVYIQEYNENFNKLKNYLYNDLKVFDDMQNSTFLSNYNIFIKYYEDYYESEEYAQAALSGTATATIRTLLSLKESGTAGEVAYYDGILYRYTNGSWQIIESGGYKGVCEDIPEAKIGNYFYPKNNFTGKVALKTTKGFLKVGGKLLAIKKKFLKGYLYEFTVTGWKIITDKNDYRYLITTNDLIEITGTVSNNLSNYIGSVAENAAVSKGERMNYIGICTLDQIPEAPRLGDFFLFNGVTTEVYEKGSLYKYSYDIATEKNTWAKLDPKDPASYQYYMAALNSMTVEYENASIGVFTSIFCKTIAAQQAFIDELQTKVIELQEGGIIKSKNYKSNPEEEEYAGFKISYDGTMEMYSGIFRGAIQSGPLSIDMADRNPVTLTTTSTSKWRDVISYLNGKSIYWSTYNITGIINNKNVKEITIKKSYSESYTVSEEYFYDPGYKLHAKERCSYGYSVQTYTYTMTIKDTSLNTFTISGVVTDQHYVKKGDNYYGSDDRSPIPAGFWKEPPFYDNYLSDNMGVAIDITFTGDEKVLKLLNIPTSTEGYTKGTLYSANGYLKIIP